jgi:hypothetical protein
MIVTLSYNLPDELELYKKHLKEKGETMPNSKRIDIHRYFLVNKDKITEKAKSLGLNKIDFSKTYNLVKTGEKNQSPFGYPARMQACKNAKISVAGDNFVEEDFFVWLIAEGTLNSVFFKTSPIVAFEQISDEVYSIETENSFYELHKVNSDS